MRRHYRFRHDERLGIRLPELDLDWHEYPESVQAEILLEWEIIRGSIPDRVRYFEEHIRVKQEKLNSEENFAESCRINSEIAELASCINDLHLWYRVNQSIESRRVHS